MNVFFALKMLHALNARAYRHFLAGRLYTLPIDDLTPKEDHVFLERESQRQLRHTSYPVFSRNSDVRCNFITGDFIKLH